jgi:CspA family cold shock protein
MRPHQSHHHGGHRRGPPPPRRHPALSPLKSYGEMQHDGKVKWFDRARGYGFISDEITGKDVFVHASTIDAYRINDRLLEPGVPVRYSLMRDAQRGPAADALFLAY